MSNVLDRREFLKLSGLGFGSLAADPLHVLLPPEDQVQPLGIGRGEQFDLAASPQG